MTIARINDIDLYYEEHGPPAGEPLLLVMGFVTNAAAWAPQIPALAARYRVVAFDNRGSGRTSQPDGPYSIPQMANDAVALLDHLDLPSAHVIGASMGGMIAQEIALRHPARVRTLVLACTTPGGPSSFGYEELAANAVEARQAKDVAEIWTQENLQEFASRLFTPEFMAHPTPGFGQYVAGVLQHPSTLAGLKGQLEASFAHDTYERLPDIRVPTLVIAGADDLLVDARNSRILAERIPGAELHMIDGQRHAFTAEKPDETNAAILAFLAKHAARVAA